MNKVNKSIGWADWSWNPIRGICPVDCKLPDGRGYCYARRMYQRFGWDEKISIVGYMKLQKPRNLKKPSRIFVCSTIELFHPDIPPSYRELIFDVIKKCPQHTFQILTKFPQNIDRPIPDNVWLGVTITGEEGTSERSYELEKIKAKIKFISYEPMLENRAFCVDKIDWLIVGRLTGYGKKYDPLKDWIRQMVNLARVVGIPIFLKDNLKEIWGESLIQEMPNES